jgi:hypothetical protein
MQVYEWISGRAIVTTHMQSGRATYRRVEAEGGWNSGLVMWQWQGNAEQPPGVVPTPLLTRLWGVSEVDHAFSPQ